MISKLAEDIYAKSILLKKYNVKRLLLKRNRIKLLSELNEIQALIDSLLACLQNNSSFSSSYIELATFMQNSLLECIHFLTSKNCNYRQTVCCYIWGFHNLPRAFFSVENSMRVSPDKAMAYYRPYLKLD